MASRYDGRGGERSHMMFLSRIWYVVLTLLLVVALYTVFLAVGEYNRRGTVAMTEELAGDVQVVGWQLQIDSRHRLDALLYGSVDTGIRDALTAAEDKDKILPKTKDDARKALIAVNEKIQPPEFKSDALFAVDHDGRVVGQVGFDQANAFDDFELGGYPAVFDAIHGFLRDDTWVLGGKLYRVVARPVEYDATQRPLGAVVGLRAVDNKFAQELSKRTRTNIAFYAGGQRVASAATEGADATTLDQVVTVLPKLAQDKAYVDGRSDVQMLADDPSAAGAIFARLAGDAWDGGGGFAVVRSRVALAGPLGFLSGADDKDKQGVNLPILALVLVVGIAFGILFSILEHSLPMREMVRQASAIRRGEIDYLQLPRFRGGYRGIAQDINSGIERVLEKGGGAARKPADLASILGPVPAQPAMSAFSFPMPDGNPQPPTPPPRPTGSQPRPLGPPPPASPSRPNLPPFPQQQPPSAYQQPPMAAAPMAIPTPPPISSGPASGALGEAPTMQAAAPAPAGGIRGTMLGMGAPGAAPARPPQGPGFFPPPRGPVTASQGTTPIPASIPQAPVSRQPVVQEQEEQEDATVVAPAPSDLIAQASGAGGASESAEWLSVYDDFVKTKKQCGEPTDGLTFEKFQHTLKKNRDQLIQRHSCKRVRFSVYVKEGRASLKATPVRE
jgi:hypothetical protein